MFDQNGRVLQQTSISEQAVLYAEVPQLTGTTPAQKLGDLPALLLAARHCCWSGDPGGAGMRDLTESADHPR